MRSFIVFLCFIPVLLFSCRSVSLETQLKEAIKDKKAEIGIAVIIDEKDTVTVNNDIHYPLMSVFKFHQALALADYMAKRNQSLDTLLRIEKSDLKPNTYSPLYNPQNHLAADNKTTCFIFPLKQKTKRLKKRSKQHTKSVIQMLFKSH